LAAVDTEHFKEGGGGCGDDDDDDGDGKRF